MAKKLTLEKAMMMMFPKERQVRALLQGPLMGHQIEKENMYLLQRVEKKSRGQTEILLTEMKETMKNTKINCLGYFLLRNIRFFKGRKPKASYCRRCFFENSGCISSTASSHSYLNSHPSYVLTSRSVSIWHDQV